MYYCDHHIPAEWNLTWLSTGNCTGSSHASFRASHTGTTPTKPHNGFFFFGGDANRYQAFQQSFAAPDFVHSGQGGRISAINVFDAPIGIIETHGVPICTTCTGMTVLINLPDVSHGFPYRHTGSGISCSVCGVNLSKRSGRTLR